MITERVFNKARRAGILWILILSLTIPNPLAHAAIFVFKYDGKHHEAEARTMAVLGATGGCLAVCCSPFFAKALIKKNVEPGLKVTTALSYTAGALAGVGGICMLAAVIFFDEQAPMPEYEPLTLEDAKTLQLSSDDIKEFNEAVPFFNEISESIAQDARKVLVEPSKGALLEYTAKAWKEKIQRGLNDGDFSGKAFEALTHIEAYRLSMAEPVTQVEEKTTAAAAAASVH